MPNVKMFPNSVVPLPNEGISTNGMIVNAIQPVHLDEVMKLHFSLDAPKTAEDALEAKVAKGEVITGEELKRDYSADPASAASLRDWLVKQGFEISKTTGDNTSVYASGTVDQIQKSLGVHMVRVTNDGATVTAASDAPGLPANVGKDVQHIGGLQPFFKAHKHLRRRPVGIPSAPAVPQAIAGDGYLVSQILKAYNADGLGLTGQGQEIGILIDTFADDADVTMFWQKNAVQNQLANIVKINVGGGPLPSIEGEETLDTEWSSGIAPGAQVRVYASGGLDFPSLDRALDQMIEDASNRPGLRQVSISLGLGELYFNGPAGEVATQHKKYLRLAALGVNVFVSSGDAGSNPGQSGHIANGKLQTEYSASDPCVVAVGGTSLALDGGGKVVSETGWPGGGGGKSHYFPRPAWQKGKSIAKGAQRLVPDVSLTADPAHGAFLILNGQPVKGGIGGTSWSAPVWAAFCALINEGRLKQNKKALPFLNPLIYPLLGTNAFRDIVGGSNGAYSAIKGFDLVTGIGVPDVAELLKALP